MLPVLLCRPSKVAKAWTASAICLPRTRRTWSKSHRCEGFFLASAGGLWPAVLLHNAMRLHMRAWHATNMEWARCRAGHVWVCRCCRPAAGVVVLVVGGGGGTGARCCWQLHPIAPRPSCKVHWPHTRWLLGGWCWLDWPGRLVASQPPRPAASPKALWQHPTGCCAMLWGVVLCCAGLRRGRLQRRRR